MTKTGQHAEFPPFESALHHGQPRRQIQQGIEMTASNHVFPRTLGLAARSWLRIATTASVVATVAMTGCHQRQEGTAQAPATSGLESKSGQGGFSSGITGYNHTDKTIASFAVDGVWGGNVRPHTGGGSSACCLQLPIPWHDGLSVKVDWEDDQGQQHDRVVPVPRYDAKSIGIFNVHFLRNGEIRVFDLNGILGSPDYPLQGDEADLTPGVANFQYPRPGSAPHQHNHGASS